MAKAIIFDFNGTLYFDTEKHDAAWRECAQELIGKPMTKEDFENIKGRTNKLILEYFLNEAPTDEQVEKMGSIKERMYIQKCIDDPDCLHLADGADEFLDGLKEKGVPIAIATSSPAENIDFYFDYLGIGKWFTRDLVIYDDGTINGKPAPDLYLRAAERLGVKPDECIVFEDGFSGIAAARNAGVAGIVAVASDTPPEKLAAEEGVIKVIADYKNLGDVLKEV